ncbi:MAG: glycosyltransferase family A protein [Candidatus Bathyarchaeia archaeon]
MSKLNGPMLGIVTPVKNESENLSRLAKTILSQTKRPDLWVIVDDGSIDYTPNLIEDLEKNYNFITSLSLPTKHTKYDPIYRYGCVVRIGLEHALNNQGDLEYFGILDADIVLKEDYYEKTLTAFKLNEKVGIVSGLYIVSSEGNGERRYLSEPIGGALIFRKKCLLDIGGFPICPSPDTAAIIKAINREWRLAIVSSTYAIHTRPSNSWTKFVRTGLSRYILDLHPLSALSSVLQVFKSSSLNPLGFVIGYFMGVLYRASKIEDKEIRRYFHERFHRSLYRTFKRIVERRMIETDPIKCSTLKL